MRKFAVLLLIALTSFGCNRTPSSPRAVLPDRYYALEAALHHMLDNETNLVSEALVLKGEFASQMIVSFSGHKPPVVTNIQVSSDSGMGRDKATGKPVELWTFGIQGINDNSAIVTVSCYLGNLGFSLCSMELKRKNGKWIVVSEKLIGAA
jgi:hypothetical protein